MMSPNRVALFLGGLVGGLLLLLSFSRHETAVAISQTILIDYVQILTAAMLLVGVIGYLRSQLKKAQRPSERIYSLIGMFGFFVMVISAMIFGTGGETPFAWSFENLLVPLQSTVFALLAFFVASASLRGFRARSAAATILLVAAAITLLSRSDLGWGIQEQIVATADWLRNNPSLAARRGILIGIGLGSLTTSLRVLVGVERTWLGRSA